MDNKILPISKVSDFADEALRLGCYSKTQRTNFETAWTALKKALAAEGLSLSSPVEQVEPKLAEVLDHHGRQSAASAETIRVYKARLKALLADFVEHNGGDFMAWKKTLEKAPSNGDTKARPSRKARRVRVKPGGSEGEVDTITHRLIADSGKEGKISLPTDLSEGEVEKIWAQLEAIKSLIKAQIAPAGSKSK